MKKLIVAAIALIALSAQASDWSTGYKKDEMRGTTQKIMWLESENSAYFDFPYEGGSKLGIVLLSKRVTLKTGQKPEDLKPEFAYIYIDKGQFVCPANDPCRVNIKFGQDSIIPFTMTEPEDGNSNGLYFYYPEQFIKYLKSHKSVIIEPRFFEEGRKQFKFDLSNYPG